MNKRMNITITGAFHGRHVTLRPEVTISTIDYRATAWFSPAQIRKAREALCGCEGCQCGDGVIWQSMQVTVVDGVTVEACK